MLYPIDGTGASLTLTNAEATVWLEMVYNFLIRANGLIHTKVKNVLAIF